jgi:hypothetical protein
MNPKRNTTKPRRFTPWKFHKNNLSATTIVSGRYSILVFGPARIGEELAKLVNRAKLA